METQIVCLIFTSVPPGVSPLLPAEWSRAQSTCETGGMYIGSVCVSCVSPVPGRLLRGARLFLWMFSLPSFFFAVNFSSILSGPADVMSVKHWVNINAGTLRAISVVIQEKSNYLLTSFIFFEFSQSLPEAHALTRGYKCLTSCTCRALLPLNH